MYKIESGGIKKAIENLLRRSGETQKKPIKRSENDYTYIYTKHNKGILKRTDFITVE